MYVEPIIMTTYNLDILDEPSSTYDMAQALEFAIFEAINMRFTLPIMVIDVTVLIIIDTP